MKSICVYCGSSDDVQNVYLDASYQMGTALARRGLTLIYGGGRTGLMGMLADGSLDAAGQVTGVIVKSMNTPRLAHPRLSKLEVTATIHQRKSRMYQLADAFIALPGGYGTLDELFETLTWAQIGEHNKPMGLLNVNHYYDSLLSFLDHAEKERFIFREHRQSLLCATTPDELMDAMQGYQYPADAIRRWMRQDS